jgi:hypothetical protein
MKKVLFIAFVLSMVVGMTSMISVSTAAAKPGLAAMPQAAPAPLKTIQGTVKADGDKITFVADEDGKSWDIMNPETLKPHAGHHVEVSAHVYADKMAIHIMSVKMVKKAS